MSPEQIHLPYLTTTNQPYAANVASKDVTREQAELKKSQAAEFMNRIGQPDRADEFESISVDEYAEHKGLRDGAQLN
jgi:hypothetical protein